MWTYSTVRSQVRKRVVASPSPRSMVMVYSGCIMAAWAAASLKAEARTPYSNTGSASIQMRTRSGVLRLPSVGAQFASLAEEAAQRKHSHLHYLEALLQAEMEDRERRSIELRMKEAHLPRIKTLEEFDFAQSPHIPAARIRT